MSRVEMICCRSRISRTTKQMLSWDNWVASITPPFTLRRDLPCIAKVAPKTYEVYLQAVARTRLRPNHPSWTMSEKCIQGDAKIREQYNRGSVYIVLKDQKCRRRLRFIGGSSFIENPRQIVSNAVIGLYNYQITANALIWPN